MNLHELLKQCQETARMHIISGNFDVVRVDAHCMVIRIENLDFDIWIANDIPWLAHDANFKIQPFDLGAFDDEIKGILWNAFKESEE